MLVQSSSGKVYAILANNTAYELGIMPGLHVISTTVFLVARCRFKALASDHFDPMLVPKQVLVGGIERSENTLRGTVLLNTGFTLDKIGAGFPEIAATKLFKAADGFLLSLPGDPHAAVYINDKRDDFVKDFAQLVTSAIAPIYPAKDFSEVAPLINAFDLQMFAQKPQAPKSPFATLPGGKVEDGAPVIKLPVIGGDLEPDAPETLPTAGVDKPDTGLEVSAKVHVFGAEQPPVVADH
jgi:hypothetical protein